jgi:uncharacterized protein (TIGR02118 family)
MKQGMIKVSVFYPNGDGKQFDMDYYCNVHAPMVSGLLGDALKGVTVEKGLSGNTLGSPSPYAAMGNMYFSSLEDFGKAFELNADKIIGDMLNFTNIQPLIQVSEVVI